jgi:hypothetical protein
MAGEVDKNAALRYREAGKRNCAVFHLPGARITRRSAARQLNNKL